MASIITKKMTRDRYILLRKYIHCSNPDVENDFTIEKDKHKKPVWYKKLLPFADEIRKNWKQLRTPSSHIAIDEYMIKKTRRTHHSTMTPSKPIKEGYKLFAIDDEGYFYNYAWYSPEQDLESKPKIKDLGDTSAMIFKLVTETLPPDSILFMNNYFTEPKVVRKLMIVKITVCGTMKSNRTNLPKLLVEMKQQFAKNIPYGVLTAVIQNDVLIIA